MKVQPNLQHQKLQVTALEIAPHFYFKVCVRVCVYKVPVVYLSAFVFPLSKCTNVDMCNKFFMPLLSVTYLNIKLTCIFVCYKYCLFYAHI